MTITNNSHKKKQSFAAQPNTGVASRSSTSGIKTGKQLRKHFLKIIKSSTSWEGTWRISGDITSKSLETCPHQSSKRTPQKILTQPLLNDVPTLQNHGNLT
jgi:hypothetical protein